MPAPVAWRNLFISAADIVTVLILFLLYLYFEKGCEQQPQKCI
jgi:hypothetical protein